MCWLQVGEELLRQYLFIHLTHPADKLNLLLTMLHKLYALASGQCCEDNPDALNHHEVRLGSICNPLCAGCACGVELACMCVCVCVLRACARLALNWLESQQRMSIPNPDSLGVSSADLLPASS